MQAEKGVPSRGYSAGSRRWWVDQECLQCMGSFDKPDVLSEV